MADLTSNPVWACMGEPIDGQQMRILVDVLSDPFCHLTEIRLIRNGLTRTMVTALVEALHSNT